MFELVEVPNFSLNWQICIHGRYLLYYTFPHGGQQTQLYFNVSSPSKSQRQKGINSWSMISSFSPKFIFATNLHLTRSYFCVDTLILNVSSAKFKCKRFLSQTFWSVPLFQTFPDNLSNCCRYQHHINIRNVFRIRWSIYDRTFLRKKKKQLLAITAFTKTFFTNVWLGSKYVSVSSYIFF